MYVPVNTEVSAQDKKKHQEKSYIERKHKQPTITIFVMAYWVLVLELGFCGKGRIRLISHRQAKNKDKTLC